MAENVIGIELRKNNIVINDTSSFLSLYWEKLLLHIFQSIVIDNESAILSEIGEEEYEEVYDLVSVLLDEIADDNDSIVYPDYLVSIFIQIENSLINATNSKWVFRNGEYGAKGSELTRIAADYFNTIILPYLQISPQEEVAVYSNEENRIKIFENLLQNAGISIHHNDIQQNVITDVILIKKDNAQVSWKNADSDSFVVLSDLCDHIDLNLQVITKDISKNIQMELFYPFFIKNDEIKVEIIHDGNKWFLHSANLSNWLEYTREIVIC